MTLERAKDCMKKDRSVWYTDDEIKKRGVNHEDHRG